MNLELILGEFRKWLTSGQPNITYVYTFKHKKRINMNLNSENKQSIHNVLITDMQKRLYEDGKGIMFTNDNEYTTMLESLVETILHTNSVSDINDVLIEYGELFPEEYLTLDGTLNYIIALLVGEIHSLERAYEFNDMFN